MKLFKPSVIHGFNNRLISMSKRSWSKFTKKEDYPEKDMSEEESENEECEDEDLLVRLEEYFLELQKLNSLASQLLSILKTAYPQQSVSNPVAQ